MRPSARPGFGVGTACRLMSSFLDGGRIEAKRSGDARRTERQKALLSRGGQAKTAILLLPPANRFRATVGHSLRLYRLQSVVACRYATVAGG
jgi:hypothetical protein